MILPVWAAVLYAVLAVSECDDAQPQVKAATRALESKDIQEAERLLAPLDALVFRCPQVSLVFARMYLAKGDYRRADTFSGLAETNAQQDVDVLVFRAQVLSLSGRRAQAAGLLEKAIGIDGNNAEAHFQFGKLLDGARKTPQAVAEFEKVVQLRPGDPQAFDFLALNLEALGEMARAEAAYRRGLAVNQGPRSDLFLDYNYGRFLLKVDRPNESKQHLDKALVLAPQVRAVRYDHAKLNLRLGNLPAAREDAEAALRLSDPNGFIIDLQVYNLLAALCTRMGDVEAARKYVELSAATKVPVRARERN